MNAGLFTSTEVAEMCAFVRVPNHCICPCDSEAEINDLLFAPASSHNFKSPELYEEKMLQARKMHSLKHEIVFTHGDLQRHNIMIHEGHISGFID